MKNIKNKLKNLLKPGETLSQKVVRSGFWLMISKITERILRFIRTIIVARLLSPADFGLFGIACLAMDILQTFTETGTGSALIQKKEKTEEYLDTAWTVSLVRSIALFSALFFFSPLVAKFFNNPGATGVTKAVAFTVLFSGFKNIGTIYFTKDIDFRKQFVLEISKIVSNSVVTIVLAFILRNTWALVWGMLAGSLTDCIMSYVIHPYRPKFHFEWSKAKELFIFGKWIFWSTIIVFLSTQGDDILVGKVLGTTALGFYTMAYAISNLAATEVTGLISQITFPAYAKLQDNITRLKEAYFRTLEFVNFINIPLTVLIIYFGHDFIRIFLGIKWLSMIKSLQLLALAGLIRSIVATGGSLFSGVGKPRIDFEMNIYRLLTMAIFIYPLTKDFGIDGASLVVVLSVLATIPSWFLNSKKISKADFRDYFRAFIPSFLSTVFTIIFIISIKQIITNMKALEFVLIGISSILIYFGFIFLFWKIFKYGPIESIKILKTSR